MHALKLMFKQVMTQILDVNFELIKGCFAYIKTTTRKQIISKN